MPKARPLLNHAQRVRGEVVMKQLSRRVSSADFRRALVQTALAAVALLGLNSRAWAASDAPATPAAPAAAPAPAPAVPAAPPADFDAAASNSSIQIRYTIRSAEKVADDY